MRPQQGYSPNEASQQIETTLKNRLYKACKVGDKEIVKELLELGANPNIRNHNRETPENIIKQKIEDAPTIEAKEEYRQLLTHVLCAKEKYQEIQRLRQQERELRHAGFEMDSVQRQSSTTTRSMH